MHIPNLYQTGEYLEKNAAWHLEDSPWKAQQIISMMQKHQVTPRTLCEIGCGAGEILSQLHQQLPPDVEFHGYEISPQACRLCRDREKPRLHFHLGSLPEDADAYFDLALAIDVIEHVEDYLNFLRQLHKIAKYKILHIPLALSVQTVLRENSLVRAWKDVGHIHNFTKKTALLALETSGYEIIDWAITPSAAALPGKSLKRNLAKVPRKIFFSLNPEMAARILGGCSLLVLSQ